jgi:hypothetical protein
MHTMVDAIFNVINFVARIGIVIYIVRKYVVRLVRNSITYEQESIKLLEEKYQDIKNTSHQIEKNIQEQEQLYFDLQKKFGMWKSSIDQEQIEFEKACINYEKTAQILFEKKQKNIQRKFVFQQELPVLLVQLEDDIKKEIKQNPQLGKNYIQNIMANLSANVSKE